MKPFSIVIVGHGHLPRELAASCEMLMGACEHIHTVCLLPEDSADTFKEKLSAEISTLPQGSPVVILSDLFGGTPNNVSAMLAAANPDIHLISGVNLTLLIAVAELDTFSADMMDDLIQFAQGSIRNVSRQMREKLEKN